jgi:hypothetical protein
MHFRNLNREGRGKTSSVNTHLPGNILPLKTVGSHTLPMLPPKRNGRYDIGCVYTVPSIWVKLSLDVLLSYRHRVVFLNTICKADIIHVS